MTPPDLNLLIALDVLLEEGSVARAARRLRLSPSAASRTLARLRAVTGDPLLVRSGRGLIPTPRAEALREQAHGLVEAAQAVLRPVEQHDLSTLERVFTLRVSDGFLETFGPALLARLAEAAPRVRLNFLSKPDKESAALREGRVDLETGVIEARTAPELKSQALFRDRLVGVVRAEHPLAGREVSAEDYARARHVIVSRTGRDEDAVESPFLPPGLTRRVTTAVGGFAAAATLARAVDLVATLPERHAGRLRDGMASFPLPGEAPVFTVSMLWHPRLDNDPAHRWLRTCVREVCA